MSEEHNKKQPAFQKQYEMFKDNHKPDYSLLDVFEIYLPYWFCRQNVLVEKEIAVDRFSEVILKTIQSGLASHTEICDFLGIDNNSFVTSQFHYLIKNELLNELSEDQDVKYEITFEGLSFLEGKKKISSLETVKFDYYYNDLMLGFLDIQQFKPAITEEDTTPVDQTETVLDQRHLTTKKKRFSGYKVLQTNNLKSSRIEIDHKNKPLNLNKVDFAKFFNQQHKDLLFYDFESSEKKMHKRSICFLAFEYEDSSGVKLYEIRHSEKTVKSFEKHEIEEDLSKQVTKYLKEHDLKRAI